MMKIGDKVRFLSETGGGKVAGFQGNNIVLVEDDNGFQIPTAITDVVVVENDDYSTSRIVSDKLAKSSQEFTDGRSIKAKLKAGMDEKLPEEEFDDEPADREFTFRKPIEERKGGNQLSAYLAFVPVNIKEMTDTRFETYFVNDSNYYLHYTYLVAEGANWSLRATGEVEPNTKLYIEEFGRESLNEMQHIAVQILAYKRTKAFILKPTIDVQFRLDPVKFYKLHIFQPNDFFETPALLYTIVERDKPSRPLVIDAKKLKAEMYQSTASIEQSNHQDSYLPRYADRKHRGNPFITKRKGDEDIIVVDLHASEILETTAGMTAGDILNYQLQMFRDTLAANAKHKGQRIVFIHGKGEGVLRRAIVNDLRYRYKSYSYQDASFQEYGYGATQVTIK